MVGIKYSTKPNITFLIVSILQIKDFSEITNIYIRYNEFSNNETCIDIRIHLYDINEIY